MRKVDILTFEYFYKSMISHEPKDPPKMEPRLKPAKAEAEDYKPPKRVGHPSERKKVGQAFSIHRRKGPEELRIKARTDARVKRQEAKEEVETYGRVVTEKKES